MAKAEEFLKDYEESLIFVISEEEWKRQKVYDVDEVITFLNTFTEGSLKALTKKVEELDITKEEARENPEIVHGFDIAVEKFLNLINNHLDNG